MSDVIFQQKGSDSLLLSHHSIKYALYLLEQIPFPWLPSTKASLCAVSLFLKAEEYEHYEKFISEFHESQLTDLKSQQCSEKDIKMMRSVTLLEDKWFRCICPW